MGPKFQNLSSKYCFLTLSGRQKKIVKFLLTLLQFCIDVRGIQIRWNFCIIFFRFYDRAFYLVFNFFNSAQTYYI